MKLKNLLSGRGGWWLCLPPVIAGVAVLWFLQSLRSPPEERPAAELSHALHVIEAPQVDVIPRAIGYGTARPGDVWTAVAEVKGRLVRVHHELNEGAIMRQGEEVLRIDPAEYQLQVAQYEAEISQTEAELAELDVQEQNYRVSLSIEDSSLKLAQRELQRVRALANAVAESEVDDKERAVLAQQQVVQALQNSLSILPAQRKSLRAALLAKHARLDQAELDLSHALIAAPFDCRIGEVNLEEGQYLTAGQALFEAHGMRLAEVEAQLPMDEVRILLGTNQTEINPATLDAEMVRRIFDVTAIVRMRSGDFVAEWHGRFDRIREQLDPQTRTIRIVIAVDKPYENVIPGQRPPLTPGMFCEVELRGKPRHRQVVIPRSSVRDGHVYVVDAENRLRRQAVEVAFTQAGFHCLASGLKSGDLLVVSEAMPAIEGMLVSPVRDDAALQTLVAEATGQGAMR